MGLGGGFFPSVFSYFLRTAAYEKIIMEHIKIIMCVNMCVNKGTGSPKKKQETPEYNKR